MTEGQWTGDHQSRGSSSAPTAHTSAATSETLASASIEPTTADSCGIATTAAGSPGPGIHAAHSTFLEARGLDPALAAKLGFASIRDGSGYWLAAPFVENGQVVNHKRRLTSRKDFRMDDGAPLTLWNVDCLLDPKVQSGEQAVIVTEGELDAVAAIQCGYRFVVSVPNGAPAQATDDPEDAKRYAYFERLKPILEKVGRFILCGDGDKAGQALNQDLARLLGPWRCKFVSTYGSDCKDLNDTLLTYGADTVRDVIDNALDWPVGGLYRLSEIPMAPEPQGLSLGIEGLDDLIRFVPGTFTVVTGWAGSGKTSLLLRILANLMKRGLNMAVASFETMPRPILERRLKAALMDCAEFHQMATGPSEADRILAERLDLICQLARDEDEDMDLAKVLDLAATAVVRHGIKLLMIDPWNEIEHKRRSDENETEYTGRAIREIKRFCRNTGCAVWVVAHPTKPQDGKVRRPNLYTISGSANWANKADYGLTIHREDKESALVDVVVSKVRMGLPGREGMVTLGLDWRSMNYHPTAQAA